MPRLFLRNKYI